MPPLPHSLPAGRLSTRRPPTSGQAIPPRAAPYRRPFPPPTRCLVGRTKTPSHIHGPAPFGSFIKTAEIPQIRRDFRPPAKRRPYNTDVFTEHYSKPAPTYADFQGSGDSREFPIPLDNGRACESGTAGTFSLVDRDSLTGTYNLGRRIHQGFRPGCCGQLLAQATTTPFRPRR